MSCRAGDECIPLAGASSSGVCAGMCCCVQCGHFCFPFLSFIYLLYILSISEHRHTDVATCSGAGGLLLPWPGELARAHLDMYSCST